MLAGIALGAGFLWLALRRVDGDVLYVTLRAVDPLWIPPFLLALAAFCWLKAARWSALLEPVTRTSPGQLIASVVVGYAGTTLMPMQMGELVRAYVASRTVGIRVAAALGSIVLERLLDILVFVAIVAIVLLSGTRMNATLGQAGAWLLGVSLFGIALMALFVLRPRALQALLRRLGPRLPQRMRHILDEQLSAGASGVAAIGRPGAYARILLISALQWSCMLACAWISLRAVGLHLPVTAAMAVLATTLLGMSLPAGPGYVGTIQVAFLVALAPFGTAPEAAVAASVFYHVLLCIPLLLWGAAYVAILGIRWRELRPSDSSPVPPQ